MLVILALNLKKRSFQQGEFNKDLRTSLIFQQGQFDTGVSSLGMNDMSVSLLAIKGIEEIGIWESMSSFNYSKSNWAKLDIWAFHGFFDIWVDLEVMLGERKKVKVIH